MLLPVVRWTLSVALPEFEIHGEFAEPAKIRRRGATLHDELRAAIDLYPCDLLVVHRDAEKEGPAVRQSEIANAIQAVQGLEEIDYIPIVPVRMAEAWFLIDEAAIRRASGNPNGTMELNLPAIKTLEELPDPKQRMRDCLRLASGLRGRRLKRFDDAYSALLVSDFINEYKALKSLVAYRHFTTHIESFATKVRCDHRCS